jgi:ribosomal protein S18 acetylase RimI-like enzyme
MNINLEINDPEIQRIGHKAEIDFCLDMAIERLDCEGLIVVSIGLVDPILNVVIDAQITEKDVHAKIDAVENFFKQRNIGWSWIINSTARPVTLPHYLRQHNLSFLDEFPSLYFDLDTPFALQEDARFTISEALANDELREWIKPVGASFGSSDGGEGFRQLSARQPHGPGTPFHHFMVHQQGEIVACGTLYTGSESAMIHNLATMPGHRKKGLATLLTLHAMQEAKKIGYKHCFLNSSESGLNLYRRIGFKIFTMSEIYGYKN